MRYLISDIPIFMNQHNGWVVMGSPGRNKLFGFEERGYKKMFWYRNWFWCRYRNDGFQSDIFSSDIGITDVDIRCQMSDIVDNKIDSDAYLSVKGKWQRGGGGAVPGSSSVPDMKLASFSARKTNRLTATLATPACRQTGSHSHNQ